jgi:hypothetical protein
MGWYGCTNCKAQSQNPKDLDGHTCMPDWWWDPELKKKMNDLWTSLQSTGGSPTKMWVDGEIVTLNEELK